MTAPGGAEYLPPVVTRLLGDASDLLAKFAEAKAAQEAYTAGAQDMGDKVRGSTRGAGKDVDEFSSLVVSRMHRGETATMTLQRRMRELGDEVQVLRKKVGGRGADEGLYREFKRASDELARMRKLAQQLAPDLLAAGQAGGTEMATGIAGGMGKLGPMLIPALVALFVLVSPIISAAIGAAVVAGLGLGFVGVGAMLAAVLLPKVGKAFATVGSDLKKAVKRALSGDFDNALIAAVGRFRKYIRSIGGELHKIFDRLAPALGPLADALGKGLTGFLAGIANALPQMMPSLMAIIAAIPQVMTAVAEFLAAIATNGPALSRFITDATGALVSFLHGAGEVVAWLEGAYLWLARLHDKAVAGGWDTPWNAIKTGAKAVGRWFAGIGEKIWGWLTDAGAKVAEWFNVTIAWFQKLPGRVVGFLASMPGRVQAVVSDMAHKAMFWVGWLVGTWVRTIAEAPGKVVALARAAWTWLTTEFVQGAVRTWEGVTAWFSRMRLSMIERVASAITAVVGWFRGLPGKAVAQVRSFKERVIDFVSGARTWLVEAGKNVVRGLIDGIKGMWNWAVDKVKEFAHDIWSGFNNALDMHSPSKKFESSGEMSALGYARGWIKGLRRIKSALSGPATSDVLFGAPLGAPRRTGSGYPGGGGDGPVMVHTVVKVGDRAIVDAITPASQRRGGRSGTTGTGIPTARIV